VLQLHVVLQLHTGFNSLHTGVLTLFSAPRLQFFLPSICELGNKTKRNQKSASCFPRKTGKNQSSAVVSPYEIAVSVPVLGFSNTLRHRDHRSWSEASNIVQVDGDGVFIIRCGGTERRGEAREASRKAWASGWGVQDEFRPRHARPRALARPV